MNRLKIRQRLILGLIFWTCIFQISCQSIQQFYTRSDDFNEGGDSRWYWNTQDMTYGRDGLWSTWKFTFHNRADSQRSFEGAIILLPQNNYTALLIDKPSSGRKVHDSLQAVCTVNGGFYDHSFRPVGLYMLQGKQVQPLDTSTGLSGMICISRKGQIRILPRGEIPVSTFWAMQAGPFIIDPGGEIGIHTQGWTSRRSFIGRTMSGDILLGATSAVSLYDLADCFLKYPRALNISGIERLLNLDGGPSTTLSIGHNPIYSPFREFKPIRNALVIHSTL